MDGTDERPLLARRDAIARAVRRRLVAHIAAGRSSDMADGVAANDAAAYVDAARFATERREIFLKTPLVAGLSCDIQEPGDVMLFEELGHSLIIVRGRDGAVRAFHNICAHRGARLIEPLPDGGKLHMSSIACPFHAWRYNLDGELVARPCDEGFAGSGPRNLIPARASERSGLIFVTLSGEADLTDAHLGSFADELAVLGMEALAFVRGGSRDAACNWKLTIDTFAEGYHFGVLHGSTIGQSHFGDVAVYDAFGPHWRLHFAPKSLAALVDTPEQDWPPTGFAASHFIFPNTVLVAGADGEGVMVRLFRIFPGETVGASTCRVEVYSGADAKPAAPAAGYIDEARNMVLDEDFRVSIGAQANLEVAPPGFRVLYGRNEPGVQAFHNAVAAAISAPPLAFVG